MTPPRRTRAQSPLASLMIALEDTRALDPLVTASEPLMDALTSNDTLRDALQGTWIGHALHPLLVEVPLGTWMSAALLEFTGADEDGEATQLLTAVGILGAVAAAVTGWAELAETGRREKRVGVVHAASNAAALGLQIGAWTARRRGASLTAKGLTAAAMTIAGAAGYLGGHLAVGRSVGTKDAAFGA